MAQCKVLLDNIIFSLQKVGGISLYWYELIKGMYGRYTDVTEITYNGAENNLYYHRLKDFAGGRGVEIAAPVALARFLPYRNMIDMPSIFHSSYFRYSTSRHAANIVTVYDFTYEKYLNSIHRKPHLWQKKKAFDKADGLICISESTKKDLLQLYPSTVTKKIKVIPLGVSPSFCVIRETPDRAELGSLSAQTKRMPLRCIQNITDILHKKYILYVGTRVSYKNFGIAVEVLRELPDFEFVIIGGGPLRKSEKSTLDAHLATRYRHFSGVDESLLNILYNNAYCLLYPSSYEGFGLPLIEAMSAGCPVVAVNTSSIPEVCGSAALLVDTPTVAAMVERIRMLKDLGFRQNLIASGLEQAGKFTWPGCIRQTQDFYGDVMKCKFDLSFP